VTAIKTVRNFVWTLGLTFLCALTACGKDPREKLIGRWDVVPQNTQNPNQSPDNLGMKVDIADDGTFVLTGNQIFEGLSGMSKVTGEYEFINDYTIHVTMETRAFDFQPTDYAITDVSRKELLLNAEDHAVTLIRDD
jgi:hypothetical protein